MTKAVIFSTLVVLFLGVLCGQSYVSAKIFLESSWECVTENAAFSPRDTAEGVVFDGKMWLSNGYYYGGIVFNDLWSSIDGETWTLINKRTPYDDYSEMVAYDGKMWTIMGSVWTSTDGVTWTQVAAQTPLGYYNYGEVVVHDGKIWQLGSGEDVWYSSDGVNWTCATEHAPYGTRYAAAVVVFNGKIWLMGGYSSEPNTPPENGYPSITTYNDVWCSADGLNWERVLENAPWGARMWFIAKEYLGRMWIIAGYDNKNDLNFGDVWYTEDGKNWESFVTQTTFTPRHEPTVYVYDNSLWVVAGNTWPLVNDVWRLTLQWPTITSANNTTFPVGCAIAFTVTTTGSPTPSITISGASLPIGVTFVDNYNGTGTLSGTPGAGTSDVYDLTFTASNGVSPNANQNFTLTVDNTFRVVSGLVRTSGGSGIAGVVMNGLPGNPSTLADGSYSGTADYGWSGTVTPSKAGYNFNPTSKAYSSVTSNQTQDYTGTLLTYTLTVNPNPTAGGSVIKNPDKATYVYGDTVQLTASANPGYAFSNWSGDATGSSNPVTVTIDDNKNVSAIFSLFNNVTIQSATGSGNIILSTDSPGCGFSNVQVFTEDQVAKDPAYIYPYGLIGFTVHCEIADVSITFTGVPGLSGYDYRKYGPTTPGNLATAQWYTFNNVTITGNTVILHLQNGQFGDDTGPEDKMIVDQGGPAQQLVAPIPAMTEWGMLIMMILLGTSALHFIRKRI